jgi:hypothetical protein
MPNRLPMILTGIAALFAAAFPQSNPEVRFNRGQGGITDLLWTGSGLLAVSSNSLILGSTDGSKWITRDSSQSNSWLSICVSGTGRYLALGSTNRGYSTDGLAWVKGALSGIRVMETAGFPPQEMIRLPPGGLGRGKYVLEVEGERGRYTAPVLIAP